MGSEDRASLSSPWSLASAPSVRRFTPTHSPVSVAGHTHPQGFLPEATSCPAVAPNFLNKDQCVIRTEGSCVPLAYTNGALLTLDSETLRLWCVKIPCFKSFTRVLGH